MNTESSISPVGYSVLRSGSAGRFDACLVLPHVEEPTSLVFDAAARRLDVRGASVAVMLPDVPADIARLLQHAPARLLVVTTGTLSKVRSAACADSLLVAS